MATEDSEIPRLRSLFERARENGVEGLTLVGPKELREIEPYCQVSCVAEEGREGGREGGR